VVRILPAHRQMQRRAQTVGEGAEEVGYQFGGQSANLGAAETTLEHEVAATRQIDGNLRLALIHRQQEAVTPDAGLIAERASQRLPQCQRAILDRVVFVDLQIAAAVERKFEAGMLGKLLEHVIEESDPGLDPTRCAAVQIDADIDLRLTRTALHVGAAREQQLGDLRERLARGPKQLKAREANLARLDAELVEVKNNVKAARVSADQKQLLLRSGEGKIADLKAKLNAASSNREYQALKDQIAADEMAISVLADEILEGLEKIDEFQLLVVEADQKVAKAKEELVKTQQQVREQEGLLAGDIQRLEAELKENEKELPVDFREAYQRLVKSKGSDAMAPVEGENCGGCFQVITANMFSSMLMNRVVFCGNCGRLLYLPEDRTPGRQ